MYFSIDRHRYWRRQFGVSTTENWISKKWGWFFGECGSCLKFEILKNQSTNLNMGLHIEDMEHSSYEQRVWLLDAGVVVIVVAIVDSRNWWACTLYKLFYLVPDIVINLVDSTKISVWSESHFARFFSRFYCILSMAGGRMPKVNFIHVYHFWWTK